MSRPLSPKKSKNRERVSKDTHRNNGTSHAPTHASAKALMPDFLTQRKEQLQAQMIVGAANDKYEQEADAVARRVVSSPAPAPFHAQRKCASCDTTMQTKSYVQRVCKSCDEKMQAKSLESIQRNNSGLGSGPGKAGGTVNGHTSNSVERMRKSGGRPMEKNQRDFFESRMGHDFSDVRLHVGPEAARTSKELGAKAYTIGRDIAFGEGQYQPGSTAGKELLAHELTHTVQQGAARRKVLQAKLVEPVKDKQELDDGQSKVDASEAIQAPVAEPRERRRAEISVSLPSERKAESKASKTTPQAEVGRRKLNTRVTVPSQKIAPPGLHGISRMPKAEVQRNMDSRNENKILSQSKVASAISWYKATGTHFADLHGVAWELGKISGRWELVSKLKGATSISPDFVLLVAYAQKALNTVGYPLLIDGKLGKNTMIAGALHGKGDKSFLQRLGYVRDGAGVSLKHMWPAIKEKLGDSAVQLLAGLALGLLAAGLVLGITTGIGAVIGFFAGGVGAGPGAVVGFKAGMFLLKWLGLAFLLHYIYDRVKVIGGRMGTFLKLSWNSGGNQELLEHAGKGLALGVAEILQVIFEALVGLGIARGLKKIAGPLKKSKFAGWVGKNKLFRWLKKNLVRKPQRDYTHWRRKHEAGATKSGKTHIGTTRSGTLSDLDLIKQEIAGRLKSTSVIRKKFGVAVNTGKVFAKLNCVFCTLAGARKQRISSSEMAKLLRQKNEGVNINQALFEKLVIRAGYRNARKVTVEHGDHALQYMSKQPVGTKFALVFERAKPSGVNFLGQTEKVSQSGKRYIKPEIEYIYDSHVVYGRHGGFGSYFRDFQKFFAFPKLNLGKNVRSTKMTLYVLLE